MRDAHALRLIPHAGPSRDSDQVQTVRVRPDARLRAAADPLGERQVPARHAIDRDENVVAGWMKVVRRSCSSPTAPPVTSTRENPTLRPPRRGRRWGSGP
ncbi:hypothetical protein GCM10010251_53870 [Streptomyces aurantiogriseus]|uniref:Uncharacterized protein n=1 Tax=Streptomyces aurantiogriseus TaxID=66870 RepID=A0A918CLK8_9ACTN|nr:hypothetical protein GCM10010251_53870 [Streptomyces aurantiogriseus]